MCAVAPGLPSTVGARRVSRFRLAHILSSGVIVGAVATASFGAVHALAIVPIWSRLVRGLVPATLAGIALSWAFEQARRVRGWRRPIDGAAFGLVMFATLIPATLFSNALRLAGMRAADWPGTLGSLAIGVASGTAAGWLLSRERVATMAFAIATFVLTLAAAGPIPIVNGPPAAWLFIGFIPICAIAGVTIALLNERLARNRT
jgi:hypothetical protein